MKLTSQQWISFSALLVLNALMAFLTFAFDLHQTFFAGQEMPPQLAHLPGWVLGLANSAMIVVSYGIAGAIGIWLGHKAGLPGVFRPGAGWRAWFWTPMLWGLIVGVGMVIGDRVFAFASG